MRKKWIKIIFFALLAKPLVFIGIGLYLIGKRNLPKRGPALLVANHSSHLDTLVLMSLYPLSLISRVRPIAASDYFMKNSFLRWFSINCIDIIPLSRDVYIHPIKLFDECYKLLENNYILIIFPQGTRSKVNDDTIKFKRGIHYLVSKDPKVVVIPIMLKGLEKSLPKGETLFIPFNCDVIIDISLKYNLDSKIYISNLEERFKLLREKCISG